MRSIYVFAGATQARMGTAVPGFWGGHVGISHFMANPSDVAGCLCTLLCAPLVALYTSSARAPPRDASKQIPCPE